MVEMIPTTINGHWTLLLPQHRHERPHWTSDEGWERERLDSMHEHLSRLVDEWQFREQHAGPVPSNPRPVIIDVGVEEGDLTALYSTWGCDVVMVEPNTKVWPNIRAIWNANNLRNPIDTWVGFASDKDDDERATHLRFFREHVMLSGQKIDPSGYPWPACAYGEVRGDHAFAHLAQHPHIPALTLDTMTGDNSDGDRVHVDAITMDVEGSELQVLKGADRILTEDRPLVWVSVHTDEQWMDENYPMAKRADVIAFMSAMGYRRELLAIDHEEHWFFEPTERPNNRQPEVSV